MDLQNIKARSLMLTIAEYRQVMYIEVRVEMLASEVQMHNTIKEKTL